MKVFPTTGDRANLCLFTIAEHNNGVVVEDMRDGVQVVGEILLEGGFEVLVDVLALNKE